MLIRPATAGDLPSMAAVYAHYVATSVVTFDEISPEPAFWESRLGDLDARGLPFLVADVDGEVAGYALASQWRPKPAYRHTVEDSIYLAPGRTGQGLGRALLGELLERCAKAGMRQVVAVIADTGDAASVALHRAFGFVSAGRLTGVGFKLGRWVDTELLQLDLTRHRQADDRRR
ncbi:N-acetyltransferase family protein [Nonomuraea sp. NPDC003804]|uniref:GNAT family N-acetyltransferase n=1 Tax=Nonomuraea sp. NPDC003804 TaxID=3154547 RepID=UPI0033AB396B